MPITTNSEETMNMAAVIAAGIKHGGLICLYGDLGSGKTVFAKGLARELGIDDFKIKSPTYTYIRKYDGFYHVDLYRLSEIDDLLWMELKEIMEDKTNIVVIEWAERLGDKKLPKAIKIKFKYLSDSERLIEIDNE